MKMKPHGQRKHQSPNLISFQASSTSYAQFTPTSEQCHKLKKTQKQEGRVEAEHVQHNSSWTKHQKATYRRGSRAPGGSCPHDAAWTPTRRREARTGTSRRSGTRRGRTAPAQSQPVCSWSWSAACGTAPRCPGKPGGYGSVLSWSAGCAGRHPPCRPVGTIQHNAVHPPCRPVGAIQHNAVHPPCRPVGTIQYNAVHPPCRPVGAIQHNAVHLHCQSVGTI